MKYETKYFKHCPVCTNIQYYSNVNALKLAIKLSSQCKKCSTSGKNNPMYNKTHTQEAIEKIKLKRKNQIITKESIEKMKKSLTGKKRTEYTKQLMSKKYKGSGNNFYGKKHTLETKKYLSEIRKGINIGDNNVSKRPEVRQRLREIMTLKMKGMKQYASYNEEACKWFDNLNKIMNWHGLHALNGGEKTILGYWIDYYEPNLNIIIEWDENFHYGLDGNLRQEDIKRQEELIKHTKCKFFRIKQSAGEIYEVLL